jgi:hypothetical protein
MNHHLRLHEQYGPLVRVGPQRVSFSDATLLTLAYGITTEFHTSLLLQDVRCQGGPVWPAFSVREEAKQEAIKRPIAGARSMGTLKELEPA